MSLREYLLMLLAVVGFVLCAPAVRGDEAEAPDAEAAIGRAIAYLSREVPAWRPENGCISCHNNGDGARALYIARRLGRKVDPAALADTELWLQTPKDWQATGREEAGESGETLATIQFGAALLKLIRSRKEDGEKSEDRARLLQAAQIIAASQQEDGSWQIDAQGSLGAPATYGPFLATATALEVMKATGDPGFQKPIEKAERWLRTSNPKSVLDASATILGLSSARDDNAVGQRRRSVEILREAQQDSGGWGPFANSPSEPFDTAIALIALASLPEDSATGEMIRRGRKHLLAAQRDSGSWPETTRPSGAVSYAQHISTTAWALQALLVSNGR